MPKRNYLLVICLGMLMQLGYAQPAKLAGECAIKARSPAVVILVCPPHSDATTWRVAGGLACEARHFCNAWIWDDDASAPDKAPATDAELSKIDSRAAVAVWVNDSQSLMTLKKAGSLK